MQNAKTEQDNFQHAVIIQADLKFRDVLIDLWLLSITDQEEFITVLPDHIKPELLRKNDQE